MSTRAHSAATSRRVKQTLVRLLFQEKYSRKGPEAHRRLDHSIYSYKDLKKAYLAKVQTIHPDKTHDTVAKNQFIELHDAWKNYENIARHMGQFGGDANFTMFGVGCSFADNESEKIARDKITEQACRGWFRAGELSATSATELPSAVKAQDVTLVDEDWFVEDAPSIEKKEVKKTQNEALRGSLIKKYFPNRR